MAGPEGGARRPPIAALQRQACEFDWCTDWLADLVKKKENRLRQMDNSHKSQLVRSFAANAALNLCKRCVSISVRVFCDQMNLEHERAQFMHENHALRQELALQKKQLMSSEAEAKEKARSVISCSPCFGC